MYQNLYYFGGLVISGFIFMKLSLKYQWSHKFWNKFFKGKAAKNQPKRGKGSPQYVKGAPRPEPNKTSPMQVVYWLLLTVIFQVLVQAGIDALALEGNVRSAVLGVAIGLSLALMPTLRNIKQ